MIRGPSWVSLSHLVIQFLLGLFPCPPIGVVPPAGMPVVLSARGAPGLARDSGTAAVPTLAGLLGLLTLFLGEAPVVLHALRSLVPSLFVLPALFGCPFSSGLLGRFFICWSVLYDRFPWAFNLGARFLLHGPFG